tara:strand:- start:1225 stop:1491 length:267 start_codon:yes stop_codon:yes gene_type:complete
MKEYDLIKENVEFILRKYEIKIGKKIRKDMMGVYWKIGFELRDLEEEELIKVVRKLVKDLPITPEMLVLSYKFYLGSPIYNKAMRWAK